MVRPFFGQTVEPNLKHRVVKYHLITNLDVNNLDIRKLNNAGKIKKTPSEFRTVVLGGDRETRPTLKKSKDVISVHCKGVCELPTPTAGGVEKMKFVFEGEKDCVRKTDAQNLLSLGQKH